MASGGPALAALLPGAVVHEEGQDFADGGFLAGGLGQREVRLDLVAAAATVPVLDDIPGCGQVGDDAVDAAVGDAQAGRDVTQPGRPGRGRCTAGPGHGWSGSS